MSDARMNNEVLNRIAIKEERRFLSILLKNKKCLANAIDSGIKYGKDGHFWSSSHRFLYEIMVKYFQEYHSVLTRSAMESILSKQNTFADEDETAGIGIWDEIWGNNEADVGDYPFLKKSIDDRYQQWKIVSGLQDKLPELMKATGGQDKIIEGIKKSVNSVESASIHNYSLTMSVEEGMDKAIEHITQMRENPEEHRGVMCGIEGIDNLYHGFVRGSYTVVCGVVNGGKSTMMMNIAWNMAKAGYRVVYVSIEKEAVPIYERFLSMHTAIDYNRIKIGGTGTAGLSDYYYQKYVDGAADVKSIMNGNLFVIQEVQGVVLSSILAKVDEINEQAPIDALVVDYLGVIGFESRHPTRPDLDLANVSLRLQAWGRANRAITITGSQITNSATKEIRKNIQKANNDTKQSTDLSAFQVNTEDLGGSQRIIADADNAIGVLLNEGEPKTKITATAVKARDNEAHRKVVLDFDGKTGRITDPQFHPGQIKGVDDILYNEEITEEQIMNDQGLFDGLDDVDTNDSNDSNKVNTDENKANNELDDLIEDSNDDYLNVLDSDSDSEPIQPSEPSESKIDKQTKLVRPPDSYDTEVEAESDDIDDILGL